MLGDRKLLVPCSFAHTSFHLRYPLKSFYAGQGIPAGTVVYLADSLMVVVRESRSRYPQIQLYYGIRWGRFEKPDWVLKSRFHRSAVPVVPPLDPAREGRRRATKRALRHIQGFTPRRSATTEARHRPPAST